MADVERLGVHPGTGPPRQLLTCVLQVVPVSAVEHRLGQRGPDASATDPDDLEWRISTLIRGLLTLPVSLRTHWCLVLDACNTFVTRATAEALLRRQDMVGLAAVASALAAADPNHADRIHTAVLDVFGVFSRDRDTAVRECEALTVDADEQARRGAGQLIAMLAGINPILHPAQDD